MQDMRKQLDLAVEDTISAEVSVSDKRILALLHSGEMISLIGDEVRAKAFGFSKDGTTPDASRFASVKEWDVEGVSMTIGIAKSG